MVIIMTMPNSIKEFKKTEDAYVDFYYFLKENINIKFSKKDLQNISLYDDTAVKTALKNLFLRRLIIKEIDYNCVPHTHFYYYSDKCESLYDE